MKVKLEKKKIFWLLFISLVAPLFLYFTYLKYNKFMSELIEIKYEDAIEIDVKKAYNEHGKYILNDTYVLNSNTIIIKSNITFNDRALLRLNNSEFIPDISNISTPYKLVKLQTNDTLKIMKGNEVVYLKLEKNE